MIKLTPTFTRDKPSPNTIFAEKTKLFKLPYCIRLFCIYMHINSKKFHYFNAWFRYLNGYIRYTTVRHGFFFVNVISVKKIQFKSNVSPFFISHNHLRDTIQSEIVWSISVIELFAKIMKNSQASDKLIWFHWNSGWFEKRFSLNCFHFFYNLFSVHSFFYAPNSIRTWLWFQKNCNKS